jgi:hypothetical protein
MGCLKEAHWKLTKNHIDTAKLVREHSHAFQNTLNTTQTDSNPVTETVNTAEKAPEANNEPPAEAPNLADVAATSNPATEMKPPTEAPAEGTAIGSIPAANDSKVSVGPMNETVAGEKRDLDSALGSAPVSTGNKEPQDPVPSDERNAKKQKTEEKPATASNGTEVPSGPNDGQEKASRSKKEKIKDAVNKVLPGEGIGSRTRSRTKGA